MGRNNVETVDNSAEPDTYQYKAKLYKCNPDIINNRDTLLEVSLQAAADLDLHVFGHHIQDYPGQGLTGFLALGESAFVIHTWPEKENFVVIDIDTCSPLVRLILYPLF